MSSFYSHGKLLITAEYAVLGGAKALAIPCKKGQLLNFVEDNKSKELHWSSFDHSGEKWFEVSFQLPLFEIRMSSDMSIAKRLQKILSFSKKRNSSFLSDGGYVETHLEFNRFWGLGSSSSLIINVALWAKINPYDLLNLTFGGSGYDIACGLAEGPIFFTKKQKKHYIETVTFSPPFVDQLYFVYLNHKKNSQQAIKDFDLKNLSNYHIEELNNLTNVISSTSNLNEFEKAIENHEKIIGSIINQRPIKEDLFTDFSGGIKSLGAWGGDFILVTKGRNSLDYFKKKGFTTIVSWKEMCLMN
tara:strand:+ start:1876 stop:2781 length:906 start_codon:yes stop_codon:yes gene_type:complete